jgi:hypothetical protein
MWQAPWQVSISLARETAQAAQSPSELLRVEPPVAILIEAPQPLGHRRWHFARTDVAIAVEIVPAHERAGAVTASPHLGPRELTRQPSQGADRAALLAAIQPPVVVAIEALEEHLPDSLTLHRRPRLAVICSSDSSECHDRGKDQNDELHGRSTQPASKR